MDRESVQRVVKSPTTQGTHKVPQHGAPPLVRLGHWSSLTVFGFLCHFSCGFVTVVGDTAVWGRSRNEQDPEKGWKQEAS